MHCIKDNANDGKDLMLKHLRIPMQMLLIVFVALSAIVDAADVNASDEIEEVAAASISDDILDNHVSGNVRLGQAADSYKQTIPFELMIDEILIGDANETFVNEASWITKGDLLHWAAREGELPVVQALVNVPGTDVNARDSEGKTPLHRAVVAGQEDVVLCLLNAYGIDVNARDSDRQTPLYLAIKMGHARIVTLLVQNGPGINVNACHKKRPPLLSATMFGNVDTIDALLNASSIDVNAKDKEDGWTALHVAVTAHNADAVRSLLAAPSISVNERDNSGLTPLHRAVYYALPGNVEDEYIIAMLLNAPEIDPTAKTRDGKTALDIAKYRNGLTRMPVVVALLEASLKAVGDPDNATVAEHDASPHKRKNVEMSEAFRKLTSWVKMMWWRLNYT